MKTLIQTFVATALTATLSFPAAATNNLAQSLPNLSNSCNTCHTAGAGSERNNFGKDANYSIRDGVLRWDLLYNVDSDGDGQTNGMELGDPCGEWTLGDEAPPRTDDLGRPGDPDSTAADPLVGCSDGNMPPAEPDPRPDPPVYVDPNAPTEEEPEGGCFGSQVMGSTDAASLAALGLALLAWRRRRR